MRGIRHDAHNVGASGVAPLSHPTAVDDNRSGDYRRLMTPQKGRPSPGGEEARVVVYQPRGVGLMHARAKPSNANYTHDPGAQRKQKTQIETGVFPVNLHPPTAGINCQNSLHRRSVRTSSCAQDLLLMSGGDHDRVDRMRRARKPHCGLAGAELLPARPPAGTQTGTVRGGRGDQCSIGHQRSWPAERWPIR